jgi:hypothetical protein
MKMTRHVQAQRFARLAPRERSEYVLERPLGAVGVHALKPRGHARALRGEDHRLRRAAVDGVLTPPRARDRVLSVTKVLEVEAEPLSWESILRAPLGG